MNERPIIQQDDIDFGEGFAVSEMPTYRVAPGNLTPTINPELVDRTEPVTVPTPDGTFAMQAWIFADGSEHLSATAIEAPEQDGGAQPVRVHSECATGDIFGSYRCDCGPQLHQGLQMIARTGGTLILVRNHEGRGIGLVNKLRAYALQDQGFDTLDANLLLGLPADNRDYRQVAEILKAMNLTNIRLITNNPAKVEALTELGIRVEGMIPDEITPRTENKHYLATKRDRMHHKLSTNDTKREQ